MAQIEVIRGVDRRRRWTLEDKRMHVSQAFAPGVIVKAYARQHDVPTSALYVWRNELKREDSGFSPVVVKADAVTDPCSRQAVCGSDRGGHRAAAMYSLVVTAKMNDIDPQAWLADILARLPSHPAHRIDELLPWNWKASLVRGANHDQSKINCAPQSCSG